VLILVSIPIELFAPISWKARLFFVLLAIAFAGLAQAVWRVGAVEWARRADETRAFERASSPGD
jgi:hypothetical protein